MELGTAYLAIPGKTAEVVGPYLYSGTEVAAETVLGTILVGPARGGFSMEITRDRLASGLYFGQVFASFADACQHLVTFNRPTK
jgi:hypothetical protein